MDAGVVGLTKVIRGIRSDLKPLIRLLGRRVYMSGRRRREITTTFQRLYYDAALWGDTWQATSWLGVPIEKCPQDLMIYQEILYELRPSLIIEVGTHRGGSALYLASICDLLGEGSIVSIDIKLRDDLPVHERITYATGSSTDPSVVEGVERLIPESGHVVVILDSDHTCEHVYEELCAYSGFVTCGSYLIVEDTNLNGHPVYPKFGPGPWEAVDRFLEGDSRFEADRTRERLLLTFNPGGYLKRTH